MELVGEPPPLRSLAQAVGIRNPLPAPCRAPRRVVPARSLNFAHPGRPPSFANGERSGRRVLCPADSDPLSWTSLAANEKVVSSLSPALARARAAPGCQATPPLGQEDTPIEPCELSVSVALRGSLHFLSAVQTQAFSQEALHQLTQTSFPTKRREVPVRTASRTHTAASPRP